MGCCGNSVLCNAYVHNLLTRIQFNLMDAVLSSRRSLALQMQILPTDAGPTPTGNRASPNSQK